MTRELHNAIVALNAGRIESVIAQLLVSWGWEKAVGDVKGRIRLLSNFIREVVVNGVAFRMPPDECFTNEDQIHTAQLMANFGACRLPFDNCIIILPQDNDPVLGKTEEIYFYKFVGRKDVHWSPDQWQEYSKSIHPQILDKEGNLHGEFYEARSDKILECPIVYQVVGIQRNIELDKYYFSVGDSMGDRIPLLGVAPVPAPHRIPCIWLGRGYDTRVEQFKEQLMTLNRMERSVMLSAGNSLVQLVTFLATRGIETEKVDPPEKLSRATKRRRGVPLFSYHQIVVPKSSGPHRSETGQGTHRSPRLHMRRGHVRNLSNGVVTWVRPCLVGYEELGSVVTDYSVKNPRRIHL